MTYSLAVVVLLGIASITANLSTERASPRIHGALGWPITLALAVAGIALLSRALPLEVALAVALLYLMTGIIVVSALLGYRNRKSRLKRSGSPLPLRETQ